MAQPQIFTDIEDRVKDTGDVMTGNLRIQYENPSLTFQNNVFSKTGLLRFFDNGTFQIYTTDSEPNNWWLNTNSSQLLLYSPDVQPEISKRFLVGWDGQTYSIYHSGNKPSLSSLAYLGSNLFTDEEDTIENWKDLGMGTIWYDTNASLTKPSSYGFLYNVGYGTEVVNFWKSMDNGPIYVRSGDHNGWSQNWTQLYDKAHPPTALEVGAKANKRCIVGQTSSTTTKPWYKFASVTMNTINIDRQITFKVSQGYADQGKMSGILTAHIRTNSSPFSGTAELIWEYANEYIVLSDWVLAYKEIATNTLEVELWAKQDYQWALYHFEVLSEHDRTDWVNDWKLYNIKSAGYADSPTEGYTQVVSQFANLQANYGDFNKVRIKPSTSISTNTPAEVVFNITQTNNNISTNNVAFIRVYDDHDAQKNGTNMVIQSGGNMIIGSGEAPNACYTTDLVNSTSENTYIVSDSKIYFYTNCNTYANKKTSVYINTSGVLYGAAWNDYAEYREQNEVIPPGYCAVPDDAGRLSKTSQRLQACDGIVSDTYGFAIGETDECQTPLAVAGRVLAYCEGNRYDYHAGDTVGAGPEGKVIKMTRKEIKEYPDRIIGHVSEIPEYEFWGTGQVSVDNRIWIKIK